jgi:hypothetical protein
MASVVKANGALMVDLGDGQSRAPISDNDPLRATFAIFLPALVPAATPTDLITIQGSATKKVRLREIMFTGAATAASNILLNIMKRTAANSGGTFAPQTLVNRDSSDVNPTSVVNLYTANPAGLGASAGLMDGGRLNIAPAANGSIDRLWFQYSWLNDKAPLLNGVNEFFAINLGGAAWPSGGLLDVTLVIGED